MENKSRNDEETSKKKFYLESKDDVIKIRKYGRSLAKENGFKTIDQTLIAAAISEICQNVIEYAKNGEVILFTEHNDQTCLRIIVRDEGPGIANIDEVIKEGFHSGEGLGIGLTGAKRLMDEFNITSTSDKGTTVKMCKYLK